MVLDDFDCMICLCDSTLLREHQPAWPYQPLNRSLLVSRRLKILMIHFEVCIGYLLELNFRWEDEPSRRPKWDGTKKEYRQPGCILYCRSALHWTDMEEIGIAAVPGNS